METRQDYKDQEMWEVVGCDVVQLKYDGIWCLAHVHNGVIDYWSRHGKLKKTEPNTANIPGGKYIGELMFGSEWAQDPKLKDKFFVFDCIELEGLDIRDTPYLNRYQSMTLVSNSWVRVLCYPFHQAKDLWDEKVVQGGYEGLIYRNSQDSWDSTIFRQKATFTLDLEIVDFEEGDKRLKGTLGSILASRIGENRLESSPLISIGGGLSDELRAEIWRNKGIYSGRIISVECKRIFKSGNLRHPNFVCFHADKNESDFIENLTVLK